MVSLKRGSYSGKKMEGFVDFFKKARPGFYPRKSGSEPFFLGVKHACEYSENQVHTSLSNYTGAP
ncbi:MAG: hypothetical protein AAY43_03650 [Methanosarcina sp. 795]|jgi:hypothetical protein|nr:MAG: hypothetical protein AAY43_03650 [Methanosarcina sp. 795]HOQ66059.1 hypothetical protein [Methanosarcina thermophila]